MIERGGEARLFPRSCGVARIAAGFEGAFMRIAMTVRAVGELQAGVTWLIVGAGRMAALAQHIAVFASKWELSFRMVEILTINFSGLPIKSGVTARAVRSQAALMFILVAVNTGWRQAEPCAIEIFTGEQRAGRRRNVLRGVTGTAADVGVFAIEAIAGLGVIEAARSWIPMHHLKICTVVIGVALDASGARNWRARIGSVQAAVLLQFVGDFLVTFSAAEFRRSRRDRVAFSAI